jgi:hypothetical protein
LQRDFLLLCGQISEPPQSLQRDFLLLCGQISEPPQSRQRDLRRLCSQYPFGFFRRRPTFSSCPGSALNTSVSSACSFIATLLELRATTESDEGGLDGERPPKQWEIVAASRCAL